MGVASDALPIFDVHELLAVGAQDNNAMETMIIRFD